MASSEGQMTRLEEKKELIHLNTRLETYVTHTSSVTADRDRLVEEARVWRQRYEELLASSSDKYEKDTSVLKRKIVTLEQALAKSKEELAAAREDAKGIAPLQKENDELRQALHDATARANDLDAQVKRLKKKLKTEVEITEVLRRKVDDLESKGNDVETRVTNITRERDTITKEYRDTVAVLEKQLDDVKNEGAERLMTEKAQWETDWSEKMRQLEDDLKKNWEKATDDLRSRIKELEETNARLLSRAQTAEGQYSKQEVLVRELFSKIQEMDVQTGENTSKLREEIKALELALEKERRGRAKKDNEFNELMDLKISLQTELDKYRVILSREEERVGLTPGSAGSRSKSRVFGSPDSLASPDGSDYSGVSGKRRKRARRSVTGHRARQVMTAIEKGDDPHDVLDGEPESEPEREDKTCKVM